MDLQQVQKPLGTQKSFLSLAKAEQNVWREIHKTTLYGSCENRSNNRVRTVPLAALMR